LRDRNLHYNYFFFYKAGGRTVDGAVVRRNSGEVEVAKLAFLGLRRPRIGGGGGFLINRDDLRSRRSLERRRAKFLWRRFAGD
jgi:hypothetical protein